MAEVKPDTRVKINLETINKPSVSTNFYSPTLTLSSEALKSDLTKTLIVTILALILQFSLAAYLHKGGYNNLLQLIDKIF